MHKQLSMTAAAMIMSGLVGAAQQQPAGTPGTPGTPGAAATVRPEMKLTGCLYREAQIPGRSPDPAERAGVLEDYILVGATATDGTPATGGMYKVERIPDERLKALLGKRIEVTGRVDPEGRDLARRPAGTSGGVTPDRGLSADKISLPEIEATGVREVTGTCPATPAVSR